MSPVLASFGLIDWGVLGVYWLAMIYIGVIAARKDQNTEEYFLGGRSLPTWALAISIIGSSLSAATFIGVPDSAYLGDLTYLVLNLGGFMAVFIVGLFFVPKLYRAGTVTVYGYLDGRFGLGARVAAASMFLLGRLLASGARLFMAGIPVCLLVFGFEDPKTWQLVLAICLVGLVGTAYTALGGIRAVIWIDVIQFALVVGAVLLTIGLLLYRIPAGLGDIYAALADTGAAGPGKLRIVDLSLDPAQPFTLWTALFGVVFLNVATFGIDQDFAQRFLVAKSARRGAWSVIGAQFIGVGVVSLFLVVGLLLWVYYQNPHGLMGQAAPAYQPQGGTQNAYPIFLLHELPPVLSGLAITGFFAIAQGSMDSAINAMASSLVSDLYFPLRQRRGKPIDARQSVQAPRIAVAALGVLLTLFAIGCALAFDPRNKTLLNYALGVMPFAFAGMLGVFLTALFTRRGNTGSVLLALALGAATILTLQDYALPHWTGWLFGHRVILAWPWHMPIGTAVSFLVCVAGPPRRARPEAAAV